MPRGPRIVVPGIPHHVVHRGNNRQQLFRCDRDYFVLIKNIKEAKEKFNCLLYAYCFMKNHIHMIIQPKEVDGLSKMIKLVAGRYTRYVNKTYERTGTLWEGRFKSSPIEQERYLLGCIKYIELNPVRAGVVENPAEYRWSSCSIRAFGKKNSLVDLDPYYIELGKTPQERAKAYKQWLKSFIAEEEWKYIKEGVEKSTPIASLDFINVLSAILNRSIIVRPQGRPKRLMGTDLFLSQK